MKKMLRSFIHEHFPFDLRVDIELLSRRRDIFNVEKQEELIKLLQQYNVPGIVPLGSGTNRYAFKLDGFVVKVATDSDGKIDNFKEFKMAKRLYPHVAKTYEVSDNGTLLIAEYIEPFQSYGDMIAYADQIREILQKLSAVYLIGDVGITKKNYANWGKRIGGDDPVCLDFAYVYDVKSELFLCKACKNNSMLIPNNDFTKLICPACGKEYEFEEIRARLGNDVHAHEIGNLADEGYKMYDASIEQELDPDRSNYLEIKRVEEVKPDEAEEEIIPDNFVFNSNQGGFDMLKVYGHNVVRVGEAAAKNDIPMVYATSVAFTGTIESEEVPVVESEPVVEPVDIAEAILGPEEEEDMEVEAEVVSSENDFGFSDVFRSNAYQAPLELGRKIADGYLRMHQVFDKVRTEVSLKRNSHGKMYPEDFYGQMAYIINHALLRFCKFRVEEGVNKKGKPCKHYYLPENPEAHTVGTLTFLDHFYADQELRHAESGKVMEIYNTKYHDGSLDPEVFDIIEQMIGERFNISSNASDVVIDVLKEGWLTDNTENIPEEVEEAPAEPIAEVIESEPIDEDDEDDEYEDVDPATLNNGISIDIQRGDIDRMVIEYGDRMTVNLSDQGNYMERLASATPDTLTIPIYDHFDKYSRTELKPSIVDDRNGCWDWLIHLVPYAVFETANPDQYIERNHESVDPDTSIIRFAILDEMENENWLMGVYIIYNVTDNDIECINDNETLIMVNNIISDNIGINGVSSLIYVINNIDKLKVDESVISGVFEEDADEEIEEDENEQAAIDALMSASFIDMVDDAGEEDDVEEEDDESDISDSVVTFRPIHRK